MSIPLLVIARRRRRRPRSTPATAPDDLLRALVQYLESRPEVTALLHSPGSIVTDAGSVDDRLPMLVLEGYDETMPGLSADDEQAEVEVTAYAEDLTAVRAILHAVTTCLDSPNVNPASTLPGPLRWIGGRTTAHLRGPLRLGRAATLVAGGVHAYDGSVQYEFGMTPSQ